jgi:hypothetical protein
VRLTSRVLLLGIACLLVGVALAAFANPPDPTWLGGYWDDDDFDSVVVFVLHASAVLAFLAVGARPRWRCVAPVERSYVGVTAAPLVGAVSPRAPPRTPSYA